MQNTRIDPLLSLEGKVAAITGASKGIGAAIAKKFASYGAIVVVCDIDEENGVKTVAEITLEGGKAVFIKVNLSSAEEAKKLAQKVIDIYGALDILVNNAGITADAFAVKMTEEQWYRVMRINLDAVFFCSQGALSYMTGNGGGVIVNISSIIGEEGNIGQANYAAAKAGVIALTKTMAKEGARKKVRVVAIAPGFVNTGMTANVPENIIETMKEKTLLKRMGEPEEIANVALALVSNMGSFITCEVVNVNGGLRI